jgi:serine protease Do
MTRYGGICWFALALLLVAPCLANAQDRLHPRVLTAFREVVAEPQKSTVLVLCDGYHAALGTIIDPVGHIVTKASELKGKITCQLNDGRKFDATLVATDKEADLAVLKIDAKELQPIQWSEGDAPAVGSWLATPVIKSESLSIPIVIGVLSVSPRKIPPPSGALGIMLADIERPAQIRDVVPDSAAENAGLDVGDIFLKVNGKEIAGREDLVKTISSYPPGQKVELLIKRDDKELTITATLGDRAQLFHDSDRAEFQNGLGGQLSERRSGFPVVIQHDSVLRPAECGGPIVDLDGKAVGLNIARAGRVESLALPASVVRESLKTLLATHPTSTAETKP